MAPSSGISIRGDRVGTLDWSDSELTDELLERRVGDQLPKLLSRLRVEDGTAECAVNLAGNELRGRRPLGTLLQRLRDAEVRVTCLRLHKNHLTDEAVDVLMEHIVTAAGGGQPLAELHLSDNHLTEVGIRGLIQAVHRGHEGRRCRALWLRAENQRPNLTDPCGLLDSLAADGMSVCLLPSKEFQVPGKGRPEVPVHMHHAFVPKADQRWSATVWIKGKGLCSSDGAFNVSGTNGKTSGSRDGRGPEKSAKDKGSRGRWPAVPQTNNSRGGHERGGDRGGKARPADSWRPSGGRGSEDRGSSWRFSGQHLRGGPEGSGGGDDWEQPCGGQVKEEPRRGGQRSTRNTWDWAAEDAAPEARSWRRPEAEDWAAEDAAPEARSWRRPEAEAQTHGSQEPYSQGWTRGRAPEVPPPPRGAAEAHGHPAGSGLQQSMGQWLSAAPQYSHGSAGSSMWLARAAENVCSKIDACKSLGILKRSLNPSTVHDAEWMRIACLGAHHLMQQCMQRASVVVGSFVEDDDRLQELAYACAGQAGLAIAFRELRLSRLYHTVLHDEQDDNQCASLVAAIFGDILDVPPQGENELRFNARKVAEWALLDIVFLLGNVRLVSAGLAGPPTLPAPDFAVGMGY